MHMLIKGVGSAAGHAQSETSRRLQILHFHEDSDLAWHILPWAVRTGGDTAVKAYGKPMFQSFRDSPAKERNFSKAMTSLDNLGDVPHLSPGFHYQWPKGM